MTRALVLALALAACSPPAPEVQEAPTPAIETPAAQIVSIRISAAQNGQRVDVPMNVPFAVELWDESAQGLVWMTDAVPDFVAPAPESGVTLPAHEEIAALGAAGAGAPDVSFFVAQAAGSGDLLFQQRRFDGSEAPAGETFRVTIVARRARIAGATQ